ncbi:MAG: phage tail protein [Firmicutes bacterium]|jgi:phage tail-like protein|nr:phage tail protein [Bacillota bacterium]
MGLPIWDTGVGWSFGLEIDGIEIKEIQEIDGIKLEVDSIELKHNTSDGKYINKMLPGRKKIGEFTLTRGVTNDKSWQNWISQVFEGNMMGARKGGQINIYDYMGIPVKSFKFVNGWAKSIEYGQMKAGEATILTEKLTIAHEGIEPA